jgi:hypothetical protein
MGSSIRLVDAAAQSVPSAVVGGTEKYAHAARVPPFVERRRERRADLLLHDSLIDLRQQTVHQEIIR